MRPSNYPHARDQFIKVLKDPIRQNNMYGIVHILEVWVYVPKKPNNHDAC